jgi:hypothetical protein
MMQKRYVITAGDHDGYEIIAHVEGEASIDLDPLWAKYHATYIHNTTGINEARSRIKADGYDIGKHESVSMGFVSMLIKDYGFSIIEVEEFYL